MTEVNAAAKGISSAITDHSGKYLNIPSNQAAVKNSKTQPQISVEVRGDGRALGGGGSIPM